MNKTCIWSSHLKSEHGLGRGSWTASPRQFRQLMGAVGGGWYFLQGSCPWEATHAPADGPRPMYMQGEPCMCREHHVRAGSTVYVQGALCACRKHCVYVGSTMCMQGAPCLCREHHVHAESTVYVQKYHVYAGSIVYMWEESRIFGEHRVYVRSTVYVWGVLCICKEH